MQDPAHVPFAHHGLQVVRSDGNGPIPTEVLVNNSTHLELAFKDKVGYVSQWLATLPVCR